jgi:hypothetical protein
MMRTFIYIFILCALVKPGFSQRAIDISSNEKQHIFVKGEVECLEDTLSKLTINEIQTASISRLFVTNEEFYPKNHHQNSSYWYRIKLNFTEPIADKSAIFEFFDQTTSHITAYIPDSAGHYQQNVAGASFNYRNRLFCHKNFEFLISNQPKGERYFYFKIRSRNLVNVIIVYRTINYFIHYALTEYFTYGIFYGMILIFCLHNLLMYFAVKKRHYLYYVLYILSVGFFEMSTDGIAFQYLWPNSPGWNEYAFGTTLYFVSLFALLFTRELLHVRSKENKLYRVINYIIVLRTLYFIFCFFIDKKLFIYKFIDFIPLSIAFATGIRIWQKGFKPARFFVLAYAFLFIGFILKAISVLGWARETMGLLGFYSLGFSFILEMIFLSFAIGDQVRLLNREKEAAKDETIRQMNINNELKDSINRELEEKIQNRTREVIEKSRILFEQAEIIEIQNRELLNINKELERQATEISLMNVLLEKDNIELKHNIEKVTDARALSTELSFEEFSAKYPEQESCNKFLSELKWANGFKCLKCSNTTYNHGRAPYSRRCTKCSYEESVLFNTIFQNNRIPINKAFYLLYLMYTTKGSISSYHLSEKIGIRQSTCWQYAIRIKKVMEERKKHGRKDDNQGWSKLVMDYNKPPLVRKISLSQENK